MLVEIGRGRWPVSRIDDILNERDRRLAGPPAPACGLYLVAVRYKRGLGIKGSRSSPYPAFSPLILNPHFVH